MSLTDFITGVGWLPEIVANMYKYNAGPSVEVPRLSGRRVINKNHYAAGVGAGTVLVCASSVASAQLTGLLMGAAGLAQIYGSRAIEAEKEKKEAEFRAMIGESMKKDYQEHLDDLASDKSPFDFCKRADRNVYDVDFASWNRYKESSENSENN